MPWHWTDDLARTLIASGRVTPERVMGWIAAPVAIRGGEDAGEVAEALLEEDSEVARPRAA